MGCFLPAAESVSDFSLGKTLGTGAFGRVRHGAADEHLKWHAAEPLLQVCDAQKQWKTLCLEDAEKGRYHQDEAGKRQSVLPEQKTA